MIQLLQRVGFRRGVLGNNRVWYWVAIVSTVLRVLHRIMGRTEKVVYREELRPGETLVIAHERDAAVAP